MNKLFASLRAGSRSLKTTLALYFIPISVVPTFSISYYAYKLFEDSTTEGLVSRARAEKESFLSEVEALETALADVSQTHSSNRRLKDAIQKKDRETILDTIQAFRADLDVRIYGSDGSFLAGRIKPGSENRVNYLSKDGFRRVVAKGKTLDRYYSADGKGFVTVSRHLLKDKDRFYGVLEEELSFGPKQFSEIKTRRQLDFVFLARDLGIHGATFALSEADLDRFSTKVLQRSIVGAKTPVFVNLGDTRFGVFLYDFPADKGKNRTWGYLGVFVPMTGADATLGKLKMAIVYLTTLLMLTATLAIFVFSNRLVKPIVMLVSAMKRVKTGRVEQIPPMESPYEIEYLVHSFNDMSRNVTAAKRALEIKLEELRDTNDELKTTQSTLVQSAKMISLGQIVAGVAHELNNPIGFIYSNMHHLSEYIERVKQAFAKYEEAKLKLPPEERAKLDKMEGDLELKFILNDMSELTKSCVDGANRTKEIVLGLRTFSRVDESNFRLTDIHEGLRSTIRLLHSELKDRIKLHEEFGPIPNVECNLSQMNQVFMNLLSNAIQAIEGPGSIWVRTRLENETVIIEIADSGAGMTPEVLEKIFDPFFTTKRVGQGTGLGLSIAYGLVQKHHGEIKVQSRLGEGTTFKIQIPLRQPVEMIA